MSLANLPSDLCDESLADSREGSEVGVTDDGYTVSGDTVDKKTKDDDERVITTAHSVIDGGSQSGSDKDDESDFDIITTIESSEANKPADEIDEVTEPPAINPSTPVQSWLDRIANLDSAASSEENSRVSESDDESFDLLSPMASLSLKSVPSQTDSGSISSFDQAQDSIDALFTNQKSYTSKQENKLRFWQSLCIVFGLVDVGPDPIPSSASLSSISEDSDFDSVSDLSYHTITSASVKKGKGKGKGKKGKGKKALPPIPTSLCQARLLLKTKAHVNIIDLMHAQRNWKKAIKGNQPKSLAYLLHPSVRALVEFTMEEEKFVKRKTAKNEWLQPLLRGMITSDCRY